MKEVLCGSCAVKNRLDLNERKGLSKRLESHVLYRCQDCRIYLYFDGLRWFKSHDRQIMYGHVDFDLKKEGVQVVL